MISNGDGDGAMYVCLHTQDGVERLLGEERVVKASDREGDDVLEALDRVVGICGLGEEDRRKAPAIGDALGVRAWLGNVYRDSDSRHVASLHDGLAQLLDQVPEDSVNDANARTNERASE